MKENASRWIYEECKLKPLLSYWAAKVRSLSMGWRVVIYLTYF